MSPRRPQPMLVKAGKFRLSAAFLTMAVSCGGQDAAMESAANNPNNNPPVVTPGTTVGENGEGTEFTGALLADKCVLTATLMTVSVKDTESAYITTKDGKYSVNAVTGTMGELPCEIAAPGTVKFVASGTGVVGRTVILDYANGIFGKAPAAVPPIVIDFTMTPTNSTNDTVKVRGSAGDDSFLFGAGASGVTAFNVNAGAVSPNDALVDVTMKQVENLVVNGGSGNDTVSAAGGTGAIGPVFPTAVSFYGGAGDDLLTGGTGNDKFVGGSGNDTFFGSAGNDTVDYSARTAPLTIKTIVGDNAAVTASTDTSGDQTLGTPEADKISDKVVNLIGGSGIDTITIAPTSTVAHNVTGGQGADVFTGGTGLDVFDGGTGADVCNGAKATMTYASRLLPVVVTVGLTANDGYAAGGTGTASAVTNNPASTTDKLIQVGVTSPHGTDAIGRLVTLAAFTTTANNGTYPVVSSTATTVVLDVSSNASFNEGSLAGTVTYDIIAEADDVQCGNVTGSSTAVNTLTGDLNANVLRGGSGNDTIKGGAGIDWIYGGAGNDAIEGGADADTIFGENGTDVIYGGAGDDTLNGGEGTDTVVGGDGDDIIEGGTEADVFDCDGNLDAAATAGTAPGEIDTAVDYTMGTDTSMVNCEP
jgi:Ca2+-binding RTX toxin-like protein